MGNDFAVLFTSEDFVLASHIDTVCLPQADELFDGTTCFATGWGKDKFGSAGQYQVVLKEIDLPVVSNYECQDKLRSTRLGQKNKLHDSFICAGGINGKDTCKGDGAGKYGRIFEAQIQGFQQCTVHWEAPSAPLVDISSFERKPETDYGTTETKADQTDASYADTKADQTDAYVDPKADQTDAYTDPKSEQTDGSYSDDSAPVKITQQTYTDDSAALVSTDTESYSEEKSAEIVEDKAAPY